LVERRGQPPAAQHLVDVFAHTRTALGARNIEDADPHSARADLVRY